MNSGLMDTRIQLQSPTYTDSAYGKATKPSSFAVYKTVWGRVVYNGGSESIEADKKAFRESATITMHFVDVRDMALTDRLYFNNKYWNLTSRATVGRNQYIRVEANSVE